MGVQAAVLLFGNFWASSIQNFSFSYSKNPPQRLCQARIDSITFSEAYKLEQVEFPFSTISATAPGDKDECHC